jgi:cell division protein FtsX
MKTLERMTVVIMIFAVCVSLSTYLQTRSLARRVNSINTVQIIARVEDEQGEEIGMMYRWTGQSECQLVKPITCPVQ